MSLELSIESRQSAVMCAKYSDVFRTVNCCSVVLWLLRLDDLTCRTAQIYLDVRYSTKGISAR